MPTHTMLIPLRKYDVFLFISLEADFPKGLCEKSSISASDAAEPWDYFLDLE